MCPGSSCTGLSCAWVRRRAVVLPPGSEQRPVPAGASLEPLGQCLAPPLGWSLCVGLHLIICPTGSCCGMGARGSNRVGPKLGRLRHLPQPMCRAGCSVGKSRLMVAHCSRGPVPSLWSLLLWGSGDADIRMRSLWEAAAHVPEKEHPEEGSLCPPPGLRCWGLHSMLRSSSCWSTP